MPLLQSDHLGSIEYDSADVIRFPQGLPGFEGEREFLALDVAGKAPVVFLQSVTSPGLTFIALPAEYCEPDYRLELPEECGVGGEQLTVLVIVSIGTQGQVTANLLAPVVIDRVGREAMQVVMAGSGYSVQHPLTGVASRTGSVCS